MTDIINLDSDLIGSPAPGVYLHNLPNATMKVLAAVINATWNKGEDLRTAFSSKIATGLSTYLDPENVTHITTSTVTAESVAEPSVFIPENIEPTDITDLFTTEYIALADEYATRGATFMSTYFPTDAALASDVASKLATLRATTVSDITATSVVAGSASSTSVSEPTLSIPASLDIGDIVDMYDSIYADIIALLESKFQSFRTTWFANEGQVYDSAEDWLLAAIANVDAALPPSVVAQIQGDDQARILSNKTRAQDAAVAMAAARRFPFPTDVAASAILQIEQRAQDELAESSRKIAIMSVELMQSVIEKALALRVSSMQAANDFIKALASAPDSASRILGVGYDIQPKLISSVASLLGARAEVAKLALTASTTNAQLDTDASKANANLAFEVAKANQLSKLEMLKFAITQSVELRQLAVSKLVDFIREMVATSGTAERVVGTAYDAETKLIGAVSQFMGARTQVAEAKNKVAQFNVSSALEVASKNQGVDMQQLDNIVKAILSEASALGQMATGLYNNLTAGVSLRADGSSVISQSNEF